MRVLPGVVVGRPVGPFAACLDAERLRRYAAATNDPSPRVQAGEVVPPVAVVMCIWEAQSAGRMAAVPREIQQQATGGVHGEHEVLLHRPVVVGEPLEVSVAGYGSRPAGRNSLTTLHYVLRDARGERVAEQWWTTVYLNVTCERTGREPADHAFPEDARRRVIGSWEVDVDNGMAQRYAQVSGDWSGHHFDLEVARSSGFDRLFVHGLCTMALCARASCTSLPAAIRSGYVGWPYASRPRCFSVSGCRYRSTTRVHWATPSRPSPRALGSSAKGAPSCANPDGR